MAGRVHGIQPMRMQVSPAMSRAPGFVTIRVMLDSAADDRLLRVVAESPTFYRASEIQIDGADAPPLNVFLFRDLPEGLYHVTGTLIGVHGTRAEVGTLVNVQPTFGR
jgi:hypothetical protein